MRRSFRAVPRIGGKQERATIPHGGPGRCSPTPPELSAMRCVLAHVDIASCSIEGEGEAVTPPRSLRRVIAMLRAFALSAQLNSPRYEIGGIASARFAVRCCGQHIPVKLPAEREAFARFILRETKGEVLSAAEIITLATNFIRMSRPWGPWIG